MPFESTCLCGCFWTDRELGGLARKKGVGVEEGVREVGYYRKSVGGR